MENEKEETTQHSELEKKSLASGGAETSKILSKNLAEELMILIKLVNANGVTPETVNASCNAAGQIYKILKLNHEIKMSYDRWKER